MRRRRWTIVAATMLVTAVALANYGLAGLQGVPTGSGYICGPAETIEEQADDEGLLLIDFDDDITGPSVTVPAGEVWRLHGDTTISATLSVTIQGSVITVPQNGQSSVRINAPTLTLSGNLSTASGTDPDVVSTSTNGTHDVHTGSDGSAGGDVLLDID